MSAAFNAIRLTAQRAITKPQIRSISSTPLRLNSATSASMPIAESLQNVAHRAQQTIVTESVATVEGFKAGVLYTLLAGSVATGAIIMLSPDGARDVKGKDLL